MWSKVFETHYIDKKSRIMTKKSYYTAGKKTSDPTEYNLRYELVLNTGQGQDH